MTVYSNTAWKANTKPKKQTTPVSSQPDRIRDPGQNYFHPLNEFSGFLL